MQKDIFKSLIADSQEKDLAGVIDILSCPIFCHPEP